MQIVDDTGVSQPMAQVGGGADSRPSAPSPENLALTSTNGGLSLRERAKQNQKKRKAELLAARAERQQRARQVVDLIIGGATFRRAAEALGMSRAMAHRLYHEELAEQQEQGNTDDFRARQMARLERMLHSLWPKVVKGDPNSIREARHVTHQMNMLRGAYPPLGVDLTATIVERNDSLTRVSLALEALRAQSARRDGLAGEAEAVDEIRMTPPALPSPAA